MEEGRRAAKRLAMALRNGLLGVVIDSSIEDPREFERGLAELGMIGIFERWNRKGLTVFYVNLKRLRASCLYERCNSVHRAEVDKCIETCIREKLLGLAEQLERVGERA